MKIKVEVYNNYIEFDFAEPVVSYVMEHDEPEQRKRLGIGCQDAFEAGQLVMTYPVDFFEE